MNRSFEVWFSPGAHSGAGVGGSKAEDKKKGYTVNRSSPLPSLVGVWMLAAFDRSFGAEDVCFFLVWEGVQDGETTTYKTVRSFRCPQRWIL